MPFKKVKKAFVTLEAVHQELLTQRTNCLKTLQDQGSEQIILLGKAVDTLQEMRIDNREIITRLRDKL
jgi:predicted nucleotide-binding protein (sugar kinase/HSP70/actin superfamily)